MRKRSRVWLAIFLAFLSLLGLGYWHIRQGFSARDNPSAIEAFVARSVRKLSISVSARQAMNPFRFTPEILAEARAHFADHCAICHANNGSGETRIGRNLYPKPPDMHLPAAQNFTDSELYYIIHNGIRLTGMPAWGEPDKDEDSWKLVLFIRHLPKLTAEEEKEMERLNPRSAKEWEEEKEEQQFLKEVEPKKQKRRSHH